ncbi:hypothetical protein [Lysobacter sp. CA199]
MDNTTAAVIFVIAAIVILYVGSKLRRRKPFNGPPSSPEPE